MVQEGSRPVAPRRLEFFFDCSSPWTYLAFHRVQSLIAETGAAISWRPVLVGGVFNAVNRGLYENRARMSKAMTSDGDDGAGRKARYYVKDLADWTRLCGLKIGQPPVFPVNSVRAMRACLVAERHDRLVPFARAVFETYWGDLEDISQLDVLSRVATRAGLDATEVLREIEQPACKEQLRASTDELIARGGFGSPTMFVGGDDMYFGNDRLELVRAALLRC
jgi:2-hydroxychromene-2-carboxylate isomerase